MAIPVLRAAYTTPWASKFWVAHTIVQALASACCPLKFAGIKGGRQTKCAHRLPTVLAAPSSFLSLPSRDFLINKFLWRAYHPPLASCKLLTSVWVERCWLEKSCLQMEEPVCLEKEEHHVLQYPPSWQAPAQIHPPDQFWNTIVHSSSSSTSLGSLAPNH